MTGQFRTKHAARDAVWDRMKAAHVAAFPFPIRGRIPNFKGARNAACLLFTVEPWKSARRIKVNPDSPQRPVREEALRRGITVLVPTPRLKGGFRRLDPARIPEDAFAEAATIAGAVRWGEEIALRDLPQLDAVVCGSVAVTATGDRCGKGEGYSDIEFAILRELGHRAIPVATTVHPLQVVDAMPQDRIDQPLSLIATTERIILSLIHI